MELSARVDKAIATTGDTIRFEISLNADPSVSASIPEVGDRIQGFRVVDQGVSGPERRDGRLVTTRWYALRADLVGSYVLPSVEVSGNKTAQIFVEVKSVMKPGEAEHASLRDLKPLVTRKGPLIRQALWIGGACLLIAALVFALYLYLRRRRQQLKPEPALLPDAWALQALAALKPSASKIFYFRLSEIFKGYLERRFGFQATDQTTEEILPKLKQTSERGDLTDEVRRWAVQFMQETDCIKFTDTVPEANAPQKHWDWVENFVVRTRPEPAVEVSAQAGEVRRVG